MEDFSFPELKELDQLLATLGVPHRFESFFGGHAWAPEDICARAIEWMVDDHIRHLNLPLHPKPMVSTQK